MSVKENIINELHKPARRYFLRRKTVVKNLNDLAQADLMEFIPYSRVNKGYKYVLVVINCFSKYVWTRALKTKTGAEVTNAMMTIIKEFKPNNIQTDDGKEFFNKNFLTLCDKKHINHYSTYSSIKASIVERVIRTLKMAIYKRFNLNGTYKWIDFLPDITIKYNNTRHRTIGMKPVEANKKKNEKILINNVFSNVKINKSGKYKLGEYVRISKHKSVFEKGYTPNFSTEIFKIVQVKNTFPTTYILEDAHGRIISGGFYEYELLPTKYPDIFLVEKVLRNKGDKVYIKWLGLDNTHNSWIKKSEII